MLYTINYNVVAIKTCIHIKKNQDSVNLNTIQVNNQFINFTSDNYL